MSLRVNVNAIITNENKILLIKFDDDNGVHYNLPGGGVEENESAIEALKRECLEEASVSVDVNELVGVWEYVPKLQENKYGPQQKIGLVFKAELKSGQIAKLPQKPDPRQIGIEWLDINELKKMINSADDGNDQEQATLPKIYPEIVTQILDSIDNKYKSFFTKEL